MPGFPTRGDTGSARAGEVIADKAAEVKPTLRGWMHAGSVPLVIAAAAALIGHSPTSLTQAGSSVYAASAVLLFTVSAIYHRGTWEPRAWAYWRRFDHANIYLLIAGTYTPFALLYLHDHDRTLLLGVVWGLALVGMVCRVMWFDGPRWLFTSLYIALGWVVVFFVPPVIAGAERYSPWVNVSAACLVAGGGVLYTLGGLVYATKRPDPSPRWFGFHEVFHLLTVLAFIAHYAAVSIVTYSV